jgi:predicted nuclease of predicted toxin-antitoxin system
MSRSSDDEIIAHAVSDDRTIITADLDYPRLLALTGAAGPSLILFRGGDWADHEIVARMSDILAGLAERDIVQSILVIDRSRVRRRRLPIM